MCLIFYALVKLHSFAKLCQRDGLCGFANVCNVRWQSRKLSGLKMRSGGVLFFLLCQSFLSGCTVGQAQLVCPLSRSVLRYICRYSSLSTCPLSFFSMCPNVCYKLYRIYSRINTIVYIFLHLTGCAFRQALSLKIISKIPETWTVNMLRVATISSLKDPVPVGSYYFIHYYTQQKCWHANIKQNGMFFQKKLNELIRLACLQFHICPVVGVDKVCLRMTPISRLPGDRRLHWHRPAEPSEIKPALPKVRRRASLLYCVPTSSDLYLCMHRVE